MKRPPTWLAAFLLIALSVSGWSAGQRVGSPPYEAPTSTNTVTGTDTATRTVRRVVRGRVVTLTGGTKVVRVPLLIVRTDDHVIRVPAHFVRLHRVTAAGGLASSTVGTPLVPVTVTVYVPSPPRTVTDVTTTTVVILSTITLPLTGGTPEQEVAP